MVLCLVNLMSIGPRHKVRNWKRVTGLGVREGMEEAELLLGFEQSFEKTAQIEIERDLDATL